MKVFILLSGGLDSVTALYHARTEHEVIGAVSFDYGSKHNEREISMAAYQCKQFGISHVIIPLKFMNDYFRSDLLQSGGTIPDGHYAAANMKQTVVPFRNGIMLSVATGLAESRGAEGLVIAAHTGDHFIYVDCREEFLEPMARAMLEGSDARIKLLRPFVHMTKGDITKCGIQLGVDYSKTWSCYKGGDFHCGTCGTCVERREAFAQAGANDPTEYLNCS